MLYQSTCVGFGYGLYGGYFLELLRSPTNPVRSNNTRNSSPPIGPRILTWFPSTTPFGLALGTGYPAQISFTQEPLDFRRECLSHSFRYSCQHSHFRYLQQPSQVRLRRFTERSATAHTCVCTLSFGSWLEPRYISAQEPLFRPVSCYAFFKGWLLLSQPPGCYGIPHLHHLATNWGP